MPELRKDPVIGRWVIISTERAEKPLDFAGDPHVVRDERKASSCALCEGHESETPPEVYASRREGTAPNTPGWDVRVVPNKYPALRIEGELDRGKVGMCTMMNGIGAHEVIIETPEHGKELVDLPEDHIAKVIWAYRQRIVDLRGDKRFKYVLVFKNQGQNAGASLQHAHSQLIATPITPKRVKEELVGAKEHYDRNHRCIFCDYIEQETTVFGERLVAETEHFVTLSPFAARFPFEMWILPQRHSADFTYIRDDEVVDLAKMLKLILGKLLVALDDAPFNYLLHMAPFRRPRAGYWETIEEDYHWHLELMPRLTRIAGFEWGSGFYINPTPPEVAAQILRDTEV
jgi:UDPglucose--hexose-1-phosphate uridylyltransferase